MDTCQTIVDYSGIYAPQRICVHLYFYSAFYAAEAEIVHITVARGRYSDSGRLLYFGRVIYYGHPMK